MAGRILKTLSSQIKSIKGQKANSTSPTDIYRVTFQDGNEAFMKLFVSNGSTKAYNLEYEYYVYMVKIIPLLENCPNFVVPLAGDIDTSFSDILDYLLKRKLIDDKTGKVVRIESIVNRFWRNIGTTFKKRPSISTDVPSKFGYIVTGRDTTDPPVINSYPLMDMKKEKFQAYRDQILLQLLVACNSMYESGLNHNDLHTGNVIIDEYAQDRCMRYIIDEKLSFTLNSPYFVRVYDFDNATMDCRYLFDMNNKFSKCKEGNRSSSTLESDGYDNTIIQQKDFMKVLCYIADDFNIDKDFVPKLTIRDPDNPSHINEFNNLLGSDCYYEIIPYDPVVFKKKFTNIVSLKRMMKRLLAKNPVFYTKGEACPKTYDCSREALKSNIDAHSGILQAEDPERFINDSFSQPNKRSIIQDISSFMKRKRKE